MAQKEQDAIVTQRSFACARVTGRTVQLLYCHQYRLPYHTTPYGVAERGSSCALSMRACVRGTVSGWNRFMYTNPFIRTPSAILIAPLNCVKGNPKAIIVRVTPLGVGTN